MMDALKWSIFVLTSLVFVPNSSECVTWNDTNTLYNDLMSNYNKDMRPILNQSQPVKVYMSYMLNSIYNIDEVEGTITVGLTIVCVWQDENMVWNPALYGGTPFVLVTQDKVWKPEIVNLLAAETSKSSGLISYQVRYSPSGYANILSTGILKSACFGNVSRYPFDDHLSSLVFYAHGFMETEINMIHGSKELNLTYYQPSSQWDIIETRLSPSLLKTQLEVWIRVKRKAAFAIINVILPITFLGLLNVLVFLLVPESGERISYCITVLLAITVFMTIISDTLPKSSEPVPVISYKLMVDVVISMLITFVTILNLRLHNKHDDQDVPAILQNLYRSLFCKLRARTLTQEHDVIYNTNVVVPSSDVNASLEDKASVNINTVTTTLGSHKQTCLEPETNDDNNMKVTWKKIAVMIDVLCLIIFTCAAIVSFVVFLSLVR